MKGLADNVKMDFVNLVVFGIYLASSFLHDTLALPSCGNISAYEPAVAGRTVRFVIVPPSRIDVTTVTWSVHIEGRRWVRITPDLRRGSVTTDGQQSILDYSTDATDKSVALYAESTDSGATCQSLPLTTHLIKDCGNLTYEKPAIAGRYVRFRLKPQMTITDHRVAWNTVKEGVESRLDIRNATFNTSQTEGAYILDYYIVTGIRTVTIFAKMKECSSQEITVKVKEANYVNCGVLYKDPEHVRPGEDVELRYYPAKALLQNPDGYIQEWRVQHPNCSKQDNDGCIVQRTDGNIATTTETFYGATVYRLLIKALDSQKDGSYFVKCKKDTYTKPVDITTPVKPSQPTFINKTDKDFCRGCLVGKVNEFYTFKCETHGGTDPVVDIYIKGAKEKVNPVNNYYETKRDLLDADHNATVRCQVMNRALTTPLVTNIRLYVARGPSEPVLHVSEIKEGYPVNVTCTTTGGRPRTQLKLRVVHINTTLDVTQSDEINDQDVETSVARLSQQFDRGWHGDNLKCCSQHVVYGRKCSPTARINYKFPPANVRLHHPQLENFTHILNSYPLYITCDLLEFNTRCEHSWTIDGADANEFRITSSGSSTSSNYTETVQVVVSQSENGKKLECAAKCRDFPRVKKSVIWTIAVPYHPVVTLDPDTSTVSLAEGDKFFAQCHVNSYPAANISWSLETDEAALTIEDCGPGASCSLRLEPVTSNMTGTYVCRAMNPLEKNVTVRRLDIVVNETTTQYSEKKATDDDGGAGGFLVPVVIGGAVVLILVIVIIVFVVRKRSSTQKESYTAANTADRNDTNGVSSTQAQGAAESGDAYASNATYATPLPKSQRPGAAGEANTAMVDDTYAMPLPKSQRPNANTTAAQATPGAPKELIYADLDLQPSTSGGSEDNKDKAKPVIIGDTETEYVDIDFSKKVATVAPTQSDKEHGNTDREEGNVYANQ